MIEMTNAEQEGEKMAFSVNGANQLDVFRWKRNLSVYTFEIDLSLVFF